MHSDARIIVLMHALHPRVVQVRELKCIFPYLFSSIFIHPPIHPSLSFPLDCAMRRRDRIVAQLHRGAGRETSCGRCTARYSWQRCVSWTPAFLRHRARPVLRWSLRGTQCIWKEALGLVGQDLAGD